MTQPNNDLDKIKSFISKLNFTDEEISSYAQEFNIPEETMRQMAKRITTELKHDLEKVIAS